MFTDISNTELRKFLSKLRIDHGQSLIKMSEKIGYSASYLSLIERGERTIPKGFVQKIAEIYKLNQAQSIALIKAISKSTSEIVIDMKSLNAEQKELTVLFSEKIYNLEPNLIKKIKKLLKEVE